MQLDKNTIAELRHIRYQAEEILDKKKDPSDTNTALVFAAKVKETISKILSIYS